MFSKQRGDCVFQKVDIYSLGVMFFEMCSPPLSTGMERVQVLTALRQPSIILPDNFDPENDMHNQVGSVYAVRLTNGTC